MRRWNGKDDALVDDERAAQMILAVARVESPSMLTARARSTTSRSVKQPAWTALEHGLPA